MKWIGQHIYDNISRFRNKLYLEGDTYLSGISTSTETDMLVVDSDNKISKRAIDAITIDVSDFMSNGGVHKVVTATGTDAMTANSYLTFSNDAGETDTSTLRVLSNQDVGDMFKIDTTTHGATTLATIDDDAAAAHLTFSIDGNILNKSNTGTSRWYKTGNDDDYLNLSIGNNGDAAFTTVDAAAATAHITFQPDGDLKLTPGSGTTYFYDSDNASDYLKLDIGGNGGATFTTVDAAAANAGFTVNADGLVELNPTGSVDLTDTTYTTQIGGDAMVLHSILSDMPKLYLQNTNDNNTSGSLILVNRRVNGGAVQAGQDEDVLGNVSFMGFDDAGTPGSQTYANIHSNIADATAGQEAGNLILQVASYDGVLTNGLQLLGDTNADGEVDVTIASGAASTTTIAGDLTITGSDLTFDSVALTAVQTSGESFADNDTSIMTSAAIDDRINAADTTMHATVQTGKNYRIVNCNFRADIGTTKYYLPLKSQDEQTVLTREENQEVAVCDGRLVSLTFRGEAFNTHSGDATVTFGVETNTVGTSYSGGYSVIETESITVNHADDQHLWHVVFDTAKHWDSTDMFTISMQSDTDITGNNERIFITLVIEDDWSTYLAGSTREIDTTP